jgi:hypothetical protein
MTLLLTILLPQWPLFHIPIWCDKECIPFVVLFDKQGKQRKDVTVEQLLAE